MSPDDRRQMIVRTALPLVAELGASVTTQQIARAAGIGEATIFRAFEDKAALLRACMVEAMRSEHMNEAIEAIALDQPLEARLAEAAQTLASHAQRIANVVQALMMSGLKMQRDDPEQEEQRMAMHRSREESLARTAERLAALLEPDAERFRVPLRTAARSFQFLGLSQARPNAWTARDTPDEGLSTEAMVDMFLHGALTGTTSKIVDGKGN